MRLTHLKIANLRAVKAAEFDFKAGFNLIVGVNGVGKTTILDAISVCLSHAVSKMGHSRQDAVPFAESDIRYGAATASIQVAISAGGHNLQVQEVYRRSDGTMGRPGEIPVDWNSLPERIAQRRGRLRQAMREAQERDSEDTGPQFIPNEEAFQKAKADASSSAIGVFFSTIRAVASDAKVRKRRSVGGRAVAYVDAFTGRELRLAEFADWMRVQVEMKSERQTGERILAALQAAVERFLPGYRRLRVSSDDSSRLLLDHSDRTTFTIKDLAGYDRARLDLARHVAEDHMSVNWPNSEREIKLSPKEFEDAAEKERYRITEEALSRYMPGFERLRGTGEFSDNWMIDRLPVTLEASQLSDGERGNLALVLDLTRRLAQANPSMKDPAANAEAVVLIDEIDLHLHPKWQRQIVQNLTAAFPKCQFIATTHSPQVIGEVRAQQVVLLLKEGPPIHPAQTFGMDSNWILRHIMNADDRHPSVERKLEAILKAIREAKLSTARKLVAELRSTIGETPDLATADAKIVRASVLLSEQRKGVARVVRRKKRGS